MIKAWRREDGRYRLEFDAKIPADDVLVSFGRLIKVRDLGGAWDETRTHLTVPEESLAELKAEPMIGVVAGPSSCGCEPAKFRWVTESEVKAGRTDEGRCESCSYRDPTSAYLRFVKSRYTCDIIDVCGEADVAESIYEAEFAHSIGAIS